MQIRAAIEQDRERLFDIWLRAVRATHAFLPLAEVDRLIPAVKDYLLQTGTQFWVLCAEDERVVGFMGLSGIEIESLFLDPEIHRRGGGKLMVNHALQLCGELTVEVNEQNEGACAFYRACGFMVEGRSELDQQGRPYPLLHLRRKAQESKGDCQ